MSSAISALRGFCFRNVPAAAIALWQ